MPEIRRVLNMNTDRSINFISKYLTVLGIFQLMGLNLAVFFWLIWAKGIKEHCSSSRNWVFAIHGIYLAIFIVIGVWGIIKPSIFQKFIIFEMLFCIPLWMGIGLWLIFAAIYLIPVIMFCRDDVAHQFVNNKKL